MKITVLGFDYSFASSITGLIDIFHQANQLIVGSQQSDNGEISLTLASMDGKPILCHNNILLNTHCSVKDSPQADIIIVGSIHDIENIQSRSKYFALSSWLKEQHQNGTALASFCTGAFLLAETGLLDGKDATTHWSAFDTFRSCFPEVRLQTEKMITDYGDLFCSGGNNGSTDLSYYLIEKHLGHSLAAKTAKFLLHDLRRVSQQAYTIYEAKTDHNDLQIKEVQHWIARHLMEPISIKDLLKIASMSLRTFERRFKKATGDSPLAYLQQIRVESAKQQLETTNMSFDEIAYQMGYKNSGSFRKIFVKWVSLLPSEYRQRFQAF